MDMKTVFTSLVEAGQLARRTDIAMRSVGYDNTPYYDIYTSICDAIYSLVGEKAETYTGSVTYNVMEQEHISDKERAQLLVAEFIKRSSVWNRSTQEVLDEVAHERQMNVEQLTTLIISEWALRHEMSK